MLKFEIEGMNISNGITFTSFRLIRANWRRKVYIQGKTNRDFFFPNFTFFRQFHCSNSGILRKK